VGVKRQGQEADHSPPSSAEVKNAWSYTSIPNTPLWRGAQLKAQRQLYLYQAVDGVQHNCLPEPYEPSSAQTVVEVNMNTSHQQTTDEDSMSRTDIIFCRFDVNYGVAMANERYDSRNVVIEFRFLFERSTYDINGITLDNICVYVGYTQFLETNAEIHIFSSPHNL
jgi:hypothetical protein